MREVRQRAQVILDAAVGAAASLQRRPVGVELRRTVLFEGHEPVAVIVDLLMPREARFRRNKPPPLANFAVKRADDAAFGPVTVRQFLADSAALGGMTADQVRVDAFRQVRAWLDRLGL